MATHSPIPTTMGRPPTHWALKLRALVWYQFVKSKTGLSDYKLDQIFGNDSDSFEKAPQKVFERIRSRRSIPGSGSKTVPDLVVSMDEPAPGSRRLYECGLWGILSEPPQTLLQTHEMVVHFLTSHNIIRLAPSEAVEFAAKINIRDDVSLYNWCLDKVLFELEPWYRLALLCLLCREADMAGNYEITALLRGFLDEHLESILFSEFKFEMADFYYNLIIEHFIYARRQTDASEAAYRAGLESSVQWPLKMTLAPST